MKLLQFTKRSFVKKMALRNRVRPDRRGLLSPSSLARHCRHLSQRHLHAPGHRDGDAERRCSRALLFEPFGMVGRVEVAFVRP
jgi:hypothetical protein